MNYEQLKITIKNDNEPELKIYLKEDGKSHYQTYFFLHVDNVYNDTKELLEDLNKHLKILLL